MIILLGKWVSFTLWNQSISLTTGKLFCYDVHTAQPHSVTEALCDPCDNSSCKRACKHFELPNAWIPPPDYLKVPSSSTFIKKDPGFRDFEVIFPNWDYLVCRYCHTGEATLRRVVQRAE